MVWFSSRKIKINRNLRFVHCNHQFRLNDFHCRDYLQTKCECIFITIRAIEISQLARKQQNAFVTKENIPLNRCLIQLFAPLVKMLWILTIFPIQIAKYSLQFHNRHKKAVSCTANGDENWFLLHNFMFSRFNFGAVYLSTVISSSLLGKVLFLSFHLQSECIISTWCDSMSCCLR